jgi:rubrerythrin
MQIFAKYLLRALNKLLLCNRCQQQPPQYRGQFKPQSHKNMKASKYNLEAMSNKPMSEAEKAHTEKVHAEFSAIKWAKKHRGSNPEADFPKHLDVEEEKA